MATEPSIPDYKRALVNDLEELKKEFLWCINNPQKVSREKILDFKRGVKNLKYFTLDKIEEEKFIRDIERFDVLINKLPETLGDIDTTTIEMVFTRIENLINDLG